MVSADAFIVASHRPVLFLAAKLPLAAASLTKIKDQRPKAVVGSAHEVQRIDADQRIQSASTAMRLVLKIEGYTRHKRKERKSLGTSRMVAIRQSASRD